MGSGMNRSLRSQNLLVACLCSSLIFAFKPVQAGVTEWMDIQVVDGHLLVATEVAGVPGFSILDTGATATAINGAFV